jgi:opacity protein-like surface antigen
MRNTIFAVATLLMSSTAAFAGDTYFGIYGGANWDDVVSSSFVNDNTGVVIGGVVGTKLSAVPGMRLELDASYRSNEVDIFSGFITADHDTTALMANAVWDVPVNMGPVRPYVLAGVGVAQTQATFEDVALLRLESTGVAYQLGAGFNTEVAEGVTAGIGYRYFAGPELEVLGLELSDGTNHSVVAEMKFAF